MYGLIRGLSSLVSTRLSWALVDQGVASLGNFGVFIILGNVLATAEFGIFALIFGVIQLVNNIKGGLVEYPLTIRINERNSDKHGLVGMAIVFAFLLYFIWLVIVYAALLYLDLLNLFPHVAVAVFFWQAHNLFRRALMAELNFRAAALSDSLSYLGQALVVLVIAAFGTLTLETALIAIAATSAAAVVVQIFQVRPHFRHLKDLTKFVHRAWQIGIWAAMASTITAFMMHAPGWVLAEFHGPEATAQLRALITVCGVTHPLLHSVQSMLIASIARANRQGVSAVIDTALRLIFIACALILPYLLIILLFPDFALNIFYPHNPDFLILGFELQLFVCIYLLRITNVMSIGVLNGLARSKLAFIARSTSLVSTIAIHLPLAAKGGVQYAIIGAITTNAVLLFVLSNLLLKTLRQDGATTEMLLSAPKRVIRGEWRRLRQRFAPSL